MILKFVKDIIVKFVNWIANTADRFGLKRSQFLTIFLVVTISLAIVASIIVSFITKKIALNLNQSLMIFFMAIIALANVAYIIVALFLYKFTKKTTEDTYKLLLLNLLSFYEKSTQEQKTSMSDSANSLIENKQISKNLRKKLKLLFPEEADKIFPEGEGEGDGGEGRG